MHDIRNKGIKPCSIVTLLLHQRQNITLCDTVSGDINAFVHALSLTRYCWLVRGSLFIELGCPGDLGKGWRGDLGTFMISRPI